MAKKPGSDQRNSIGSEQLFGQVVTDEGVDDEGFPVASAIIRLVGDLQALGGDPHAVVNSRGAVTWTHAITGFVGSLWNCWQKYVARSVAGITWAEIRKEAAEDNPSLRETAGVMTAGKRYFLPENRTYTDMRNIVPDVVWDRVLKDFDGDLWGCWSRYVQGKVIGLSWEAFRTQVNEHNPGLFEGRSGREMARRGRLIFLPRNEPANEYARVVYAGHAGRFTFENLPPGIYRVEINGDGFIPYTGEVTAPTETRRIFYLQPVVIVIARGDPFVRVAGRDFAVDGRRFRFLGVNLRGLVHYQLSDPVRRANAHQQLSAARDMGVRVIRVFVPHHEISAEETRNRLQGLLGLMEQQFPNMYLILALCNLYGDVNFRVNGDTNEGPNNVYNLQPRRTEKHILNHNCIQTHIKNN